MGWIIGLLIFGSAWAATARGIYQIAESPEAIALLPPAEPPPAPPPDYRIPHTWGGPPPEELEGMIAAPPRYPDPPNPGAVVAGEIGQAPDLYAPITPAAAAAPRGDHPITAPGSAVSVMAAPQGDHPITGAGSPHNRIVDLLMAAPYAYQGVITADEFSLFDALKTEGRKQTEIIQAIWGVRKGGTAAYATARDRYMALLESWLKTRKILEA